MPPASPATGLNWPSGPLSARDRVAPASLRTTLPRQNKLANVCKGCGNCKLDFVKGWSHVDLVYECIGDYFSKDPLFKHLGVNTKKKHFLNTN